MARFWRKGAAGAEAEPVAVGGPYVGRLAFDPESGFHVSESGLRVVTDDGGRSWRFASEKDLSHNARYERRVLSVTSTAAHHLELVARHGPAVADAVVRQEHPHHFEVQAGDPHGDGLRHDPDSVAPFVTSHTGAWKELS